MESISDVNQIITAYNLIKDQKKRFITNSYFSIEQIEKFISLGLLYDIYIDKTYFFVKRNENFLNLYYYASSFDNLSNSLSKLKEKIINETLVVDILVKNEESEELTIFLNNNFNIYTSLIRMSSYERNMDLNAILNVRSAKIEDAKEIYKQLYTFFDPIAEQLPEMLDLINWINNKTILLFEENQEIAGFIIFENKEKTLYLRYWFVHPNYRDKRIGSLLFKAFLSNGGDGIKRILFWVIRTNENAIKRYIHYGFTKEIFFNYVLINKSIEYGKQNN